MTAVLPALQLSGWAQATLLGILGFALLSSVVAAATAFLLRGVTTRPLPTGLAAILGLGAVVLPLDVTAVSNAALLDGRALVHYETAAYLLGVIVTSTGTAVGGRRLGDHVACQVFDVAVIDAEGEAASLLGSAALIRPLALPPEIDDLEGYATVSTATKRRLAGRELAVPNRLADEHLESRLRSRLLADFDVDAVHVEIDGDGDVTALAVGRQPSGVGPLLPPRTVAMAVEGDPAPDASRGDPVELWSVVGTDSDFVATGVVQSTDGDGTTVAIDEEEAAAVTPGETYDISTRPAERSDIHDVVGTLWTNEATVTNVVVDEGGPFHGEFTDWLPVTVLVVERGDDRIPFPADNETLEPDDVVHVLGTPAALHRLANYEPRREPLATEGDADASESGGGLLAKVPGR